MPVSDVRTMRARVGATLSRPRFILVTLAMFAAAGQALVLGGVYAVVACSTLRRRRESGVRVALGAPRGRLMRLVLREGLLYVAGGLVLGIPLALGASRLLRTLVFGVTPADPATYAAVALLVALVVMAACYLPDRRAARADPLEALRAE